jgi:DNA-directed RNA polymerase subunit E'/Rpb7
MSTTIIRKTVKKSGPSEKKEPERKIFGVYMKSILDKKVCLSIVEIGKNVKQNLERKINAEITGKCINEGYIKPGSVTIINYSSGNVNSDVVEFKVVFECMACHPVEGMLVECICKTVTKAGIHAQVIDDDGNMPITMFIARDHHHLDNRLNEIKEGEKITSRVIGVRYELHDEFICTIGKLM